jgi:hypothetical protein
VLLTYATGVNRLDRCNPGMLLLAKKWMSTLSPQVRRYWGLTKDDFTLLLLLETSGQKGRDRCLGASYEMCLPVIVYNRQYIMAGHQRNLLGLLPDVYKWVSASRSSFLHF